MKYLFKLILLISLLNNATGQSEEFDPFVGSSFDCNNCSYGNYDYETGVKLGLGYGVFYEINSILDLTTHLSFNYWKYKVLSKSDVGLITNEVNSNNAYFNIAVGQRIKFVEFANTQLYAGFNVNIQFYTIRLHRNFGVGIEPNLGFKKVIGERHELFGSIGFDQHLTSYNRRFSRHPNKLNLNFGFNVNINKIDNTLN